MNAKLFTNKTPTPTQALILDEITDPMIAVGEMLEAELPPSRFLSLAMTKLEEASMWAKKAAVFTG